MIRGAEEVRYTGAETNARAGSAGARNGADVPGGGIMKRILATAVLLAACWAVPAYAVTVDDIVGLSRAKASDGIILSMIDADGTVFHLTVNEILQLKDAGVSDTVITYMINTGKNGAEVNTQAEAPAPQPQESAPQESTPQSYDTSQGYGDDYGGSYGLSVGIGTGGFGASFGYYYPHWPGYGYSYYYDPFYWNSWSSYYCGWAPYPYWGYYSCSPWYGYGYCDSYYSSCFYNYPSCYSYGGYYGHGDYYDQKSGRHVGSRGTPARDGGGTYKQPRGGNSGGSSFAQAVDGLKYRAGQPSTPGVSTARTINKPSQGRSVYRMNPPSTNPGYGQVNPGYKTPTTPGRSGNVKQPSPPSGGRTVNPPVRGSTPTTPPAKINKPPSVQRPSTPHVAPAPSHGGAGRAPAPSHGGGHSSGGHAGKSGRGGR